LYKVLALVFVGIIDTGIDFTHPDLADNYRMGGSPPFSR
jgi:subtilisin family serine protease